MREHEWWRNATIYEIYPRSFQDSNGDGIGDLQGITKRLDYLSDGTSKSLQVGGLWLTPIYPSPLFDFGYDVSDYVGIAPEYGSIEDFDQLIREADSRNLHVVMDLVSNHTSHQHAWFQESRSSRDNPKRDWYIWRDARQGEKFPNNWASVFGGRAWEWDDHTEQFYCHAFLKEQPDLNWENPEVRAAIADVMRFWLKRGVAGFRLDAIAHIGKHPGLPDNPLKPGIGSRKEPGWDDQIHEFDLADPVMHPWLQEIRHVADEFNALLIGEIYSLRPETLASFARNEELHSVFNFQLLLSPWRAASFRDAVESLQNGFSTGVWPSPVIDNHDNHRSFSRWDAPGIGVSRAKLAGMMLLTLRGTPYLYYGQEIGMRDVEVTADQLRDPASKGDPAKSRDPERTPMQWDGNTNAGFTAGIPWLPLDPNFPRVNVQAEDSEPNSLLSLYRKLGDLRQSHPALTVGTYRSLDCGSDDVYAYLRTEEVEPKEEILVVLNFGSSSVDLDFSELGSSMILLLDTGGDEGRKMDEHSISVGSTSGMVLEIQAPAGAGL